MLAYTVALRDFRLGDQCSLKEALLIDSASMRLNYTVSEIETIQVNKKFFKL